jgi:hypothetical protein
MLGADLGLFVDTWDHSILPYHQQLSSVCCVYTHVKAVLVVVLAQVAADVRSGEGGESQKSSNDELHVVVLRCWVAVCEGNQQ